MDQDKLVQLWQAIESDLWDRGVVFDPVRPNVDGIDVPGNRSDVITHILISRIINAIAWKATDEEGNVLSYLRLHEIAAYIVPGVVAWTKRIKRGAV